MDSDGTCGLKYRDIGGGISVGEMRYTGIGWK
jgi:hypothetical protein